MKFNQSATERIQKKIDSVDFDREPSVSLKMIVDVLKELNVQIEMCRELIHAKMDGDHNGL
tara:strand:- start:971 stop:1153 length:183 start_codon:yes stop_codon:yes gene_type:complete